MPLRMSEYLESKVRERRARLAALQRETDVLTAELRAYEDALRNAQGGAPSATFSQPITSAATPAPSGHWGKIIDDLVASHSTFTTDDVQKALETFGHQIERKSIRSKLATLVNAGKIERLQEGLFSGPRSAPIYLPDRQD